MYPVIYISGIEIDTYYIFLYSAIVIALLLFVKDALKEGISLLYSLIFSFVTIIFTLLFSRFIFLITLLPKVGIKNYFIMGLRFWEGGISVLTAILSGTMIIIFISKIFRIKVWKILDLVSSPFILGQAIGRIGCFMAGCCYGKPTDSFLGVVFTHPRTIAPRMIKLHPVQLYEVVGNICIFVFLRFLWRRRKKVASYNEGRIFSFYLILYSFLRLILENFRGESLLVNIRRGEEVFLTFKVPVLLCWVGILTGFFIYFKTKKTKDIK